MTTHYRDLAHKADKVNLPVYVPAMTRARPKGAFYRRGGKRALDVALILLSAPFVVPIILLLVLCVASQGGKPFYTQERIGRDGKVYRIWKLRTMVADADACLQDYLGSDPKARAEWDTTQKLKTDPRITPIGRILRKCSLDELPQLWNVLKGDMSLIGPRPMMTSQAALYSGTAYYNLRPGISGSWQVSARNESSFAERAVFDTTYYENLSLSEDVRILAATARVVVRATGY